MEIDFDVFLEWANSHFGEDNVKIKGEEICINSPFAEGDRNYHLQTNCQKNCYHCWKSDEKGNLYKLVQEMTGCSYIDAKEILGGDQYLRNLEKKLEKFFEKKNEAKKKVDLENSLLKLPADTYLISSMPAGTFRNRAEKYLEKRGLSNAGLYYCGNGRYADRIVIPYYGPTGELIYFNSRDISGTASERYLGPPSKSGVGKGDVIWMRNWPKKGEKIYLTEGEFDAMSLCEAGFNGAASGGKNFGEKQMQLVKDYQVTICFDLDKSGLQALNKVGISMRSGSITGKDYIRPAGRSFSYVIPANGFKDWNDMLVKCGKVVLHHYIKSTEKVLDWGDLVEIQLKSS